MKREWLTKLGLSSDVIEKIMTENGRDIEKQKADGAEYKKKFESLQTEYEESKRKAEKDFSDYRKNSAVCSALKKWVLLTANWQKQSLIMRKYRKAKTENFWELKIR